MDAAGTWHGGLGLSPRDTDYVDIK